MRTLLLRLALLSSLACPALANTTVKLGSVKQLTGAKDLDLASEIVYAINFSNDDPVRTVKGINFLPDNKPITGAVLVGQNQVAPWQTKPEFGGTADDDALEGILEDIRWANTGSSQRLRATLNVTAGEEYKLQILISGNTAENRRWDIRVNGQDAVDEITSLGASPGESYDVGRATLYSYQFVASASTVVVEMGNLFGANDGGDRNPIWQALVLGRIAKTPEDITLTPNQFFATQKGRVGLLAAVDGNGDARHVFAFAAGEGDKDNAKFLITGNELLPRPEFIAGQPAGTTFFIRLRVTDTVTPTRFLEKALAVTLASPHAPTAIQANTNLIASSAKAGSTVAKLFVTDADVFDAHSLSLAPGAGDRDNALFTIAGDELKLAQALPAGSKQVEIRVKASDLADLSFEQALVFGLGDTQVRLNEVMAANASTVKDEVNRFKPWFELANLQSNTVDLTGWYLSDEASNLKKWQFPSFTLEPKGLVVLFADFATKAPVPDSVFHVSFDLGLNGGKLYLTKPDGTTVASQLKYPELHPDVSFGYASDAADGKPSYLLAPSPRAENGVSAKYETNSTKLSQARGFYQEPFALSMTAEIPGSVIRYTLDGSKPSASTGEVYSAPITITPDTNAAKKGSRIVRAIAVHPQAAYAPVATNTYLFLNGTGTPSVDGVLTQGNFRANILNHATYGPLMRDALLALPSLSVVGPARPPTGAVPAEASIELFDPQGREPGFVISGALRATGTSSLGSNPKSAMSIIFKGIYGQGRLRYPVFWNHPYAAYSEAKEYNELRIRNCSHDTFFWLGTRENPPVPYGAPPVRRSGDAQLVRNIWVEDMQFLMGQEGKRGRMVQLYLNGSYNGIYHIHEHPDDDYMASYYGGTERDWHFTGGGTTGSDNGNGDTWRATWNKVKASTAASGNYETAKRWIDVSNLADYLILNFYAGNDWDWSAQHNWSAAGPKEMDRGGWKIFQQDSDIILQDINADATDQTVPDGLFHGLMRHQDFKILFRDRVYKHYFHDGVLTPKKVAEYYNYRMNEIFTAIVAETARWQPTSSVGPLPWDRDGEWLNEWNYMRNVYFPYRTDVMLRQFRARGWYGIDAPEFNRRGGEVAPGFVVDLAGPPKATVYYTTDGSDPRASNNGPSSSAKIYSTPASAEVSIVPAGSVWKYLPANAEPSGNWKAAEFDDSAWKSGPGELGYGLGDEATVVDFLDNAGQKNMTTYFRRTFEVADPSLFPSLTLRLKRDDGSVVYLNGREVARSNLPNGPIASDTKASTPAGDNGKTWIEFPLSATFFTLNKGRNVFAVEIHQITVADSDIRFDLELLGNAVNKTEPIVITGSTVIRTRALLGSADWSPINEASFVPTGTSLASSANFCLTEVHYNPDGAGETEFLEFMNTSSQAIDASSVSVGGRIELSLPLGSVIPAGGRVVVTRNQAAFDARYRDPASPYFREGIVVLGTWSANPLSNSGETLTIFAADKSLIATVSYKDSGDWPGRADGRGSSLELIDPAKVPTTTTEKGTWLSKAENWRASAEYHGTPGYAGQGPDNRVVINEVLSAPIPPATDSIELHNRTALAISLTNWFLSDDSDNYRQYKFPAGASIPAGGYLVLTEADFNNKANPASLVPFGLSAEGQSVYLLEADAKGNLLRFVDRVEFGQAEPGKSFGRSPNATGPLNAKGTPSLGQANGDAGPTGYDAWAATAFPAGVDKSANGDPDGDRLSNLMEFALATSPTSPNAVPIRLDIIGQKIRYQVRGDLGTLKVRLALSEDLRTWDSSEAQLEVLERQSEGAVTNLTVRLKNTSPSKRFLRLEASQ